MTEVHIIILCLVFLFLTKIPDFVTTWNGLRHLPASYEQNPIVRALFMRIGIVPTFLVIGLMYLVTLFAIYRFYFVMAEELQFLYVVGLIPSSVFIGVVQIQVGIYNKSSVKKGVKGFR